MGQLIDKIWESDIEFYNYNDDDIKELLQLSENARIELESKIDDKQKRLFDEYYEHISEYFCKIEKCAFSNGFSLGMRMACEAFENSDKLI